MENTAPDRVYDFPTMLTESPGLGVSMPPDGDTEKLSKLSIWSGGMIVIALA